MLNKLINPLCKFKSPSDIPKGLENIPVIYAETPAEYAQIFVKSMSEMQRIRFVQMLNHGVDAGRSVAEVYGVDPEQFMDEVRSII